MTTSPSWRLVALLALFSRARFGELTLRGQARAADRESLPPTPHRAKPQPFAFGLRHRARSRTWGLGAWEPGSSLHEGAGCGRDAVRSSLVSEGVGFGARLMLLIREMAGCRRVIGIGTDSTTAAVTGHW